MTENSEEIGGDEMELDDEQKVEQIEKQINHLHGTLDEIKDAGRQISNQLAMEAGEVDEENLERYQALIQRANLLTARVEHGDRAIVRGE